MAKAIDTPGSLVPAAEIRSFLNTLPRAVRPFRQHEDAGVREITLRDLYESTLAGVNYLIRLWNEHEPDPRDFLTIFLNLRTSLNPFLFENRHVRSITLALAAELAESVEDQLSDESCDLWALCLLDFVLPDLTRSERQRTERLLRRARRLLRQDPGSLSIPASNPVVEALDSGESVAERDGEETIWDVWLLQVLEVRYAEALGLAKGAERFYERTVTELERIPFREDYLLGLYNVLTHTSYGLTLFNRLPMFGNATARKLADRGMEFFSWLERKGLYNDDPETLAEFLDAFLKGPSRGYGEDPRFGTITYRILDAQGADGGWHLPDEPTERAAGEGDGLYDLYHPTWVCIDALRPMKHDLRNPENRRLRLC